MKHDQFAGMVPYAHTVRLFVCAGSNKTSVLALCVLSAVTFMLLYFCFRFFKGLHKLKLSIFLVVFVIIVLLALPLMSMLLASDGIHDVCFDAGMRYQKTTRRLVLSVVVTISGQCVALKFGGGVR